MGGPRQESNIWLGIDESTFFPHLSKILLDPLLAIFERFGWCAAVARIGKEKDQTTKEKSHPANDERHAHSIHLKILKRTF
jgi:hypothetical protein